MHVSSGLIALLVLAAPVVGQVAPTPQPNADSPSRASDAGDLGEVRKSLTAHVRGIVQDKKAKMWFATDGEGVCRYDGTTFTYFTEKDGLPNNFVRTVQEDGEGNLWITSRAGLCRFDGKSFSRVEGPADSPTGENSFEIRRPGPDALWFPAPEGAHVYDGKTLRFLSLPIDDADIRTRRVRPDLNPYDVYSVHRDRAGNIWIGTASRGVCRYDWKTFTWFRDKDLDKAAVRAIYQDSRGGTWFGNSGVGLFRYDGTSLTNFGIDHNISNLSWLADRFVRMPGKIADPHSITEDSAGNLWIGVFDSGAWRYDGKTMTNFTTKDGLNTDSVSAIYEDRSGKLWFGTYNGVCTFDGKAFSRVGGPLPKP